MKVLPDLALTMSEIQSNVIFRIIPHMPTVYVVIMNK